ncbi:MAG: ParB/RepB/Spo0J family partition protein [Gammaproteobacteria bacterium]|nr:ParB/RepB/Spo0J family partition protein [Gammaproteobacteria bacterium]
MSGKKRGLGRGLGALIGDIQPAAAIGESKDGDGEQLRHLPVDVLQRGKYQPRTDMRTESLEELADSIRAQGVVQPIVVRGLTQGGYEIIAGERRWRAAQLAGLHEIPAVVRDVSDQAAIAMALIENIQREDLNPIEEALALQRLIDEFSLTHQEAAEAVGRSRTGVSNLLRLLELNGDVKRFLECGDLEMGHARALLSLHDALQREAAAQVIAKEMTVRETEQLVRNLQSRAANGAAGDGKQEVDSDIRKLEEELAEKIGAKVKFQHSAKGKGKLLIHYNSLDELDGILEHIN